MVNVGRKYVLAGMYKPIGFKSIAGTDTDFGRFKTSDFLPPNGR